MHDFIVFLVSQYSQNILLVNKKYYLYFKEFYCPFHKLLKKILPKQKKSYKTLSCPCCGFVGKRGIKRKHYLFNNNVESLRVVSRRKVPSG